jgi:uncharacterized protein with beta-barrel porin domain
MRDAIFAYGPIANATVSPTTKDTDYYAGGAVGTTYIDLGAMSTLSRFTRHTLDRDLYAVWRALSAFAAADYIIPFIVDDVAASMASALAYIATYAPTVTGIVWPIGQVWRHRAPETSRRYMVQGLTAKSSGSYTATTFEVFFEHGARAGLALTLGGSNL